MRQKLSNIKFLLLLALCGLTGCDENQKRKYQSSIEWNGIDIVVIAVDQILPIEKQGGDYRTPLQILETLYYMLKGREVQDLKTERKG